MRVLVQLLLVNYDCTAIVILYWYRLLFVYFDAGFKPCKTCRTNKTEGGFRLFSVAHHHFTVEPCSGKWRPTTKGEGNGHFGSLYISGKLPSYPSPRPTFTLTFHLEKNVGLGEGLVVPSRGGGGSLRRVGWLREGKCEAEPLLPLLSCSFCLPQSLYCEFLFILSFLVYGDVYFFIAKWFVHSLFLSVQLDREG